MKENVPGKRSIFIKDGVNYFAPFVAICSLFFLWGIAHGMLDTLDKNFQMMLDLHKWQSSFVQFSLYGAYLGMSLPAGYYMKKHGYKKGIILGLVLFAIGALLAAGTAPFQSFILFLICLLIIGCGLAVLENAANPYSIKLGPRASAGRRINIAQAFNGLAWVLGPLVALYVYRNQSHVAGEKMISIILPFVVIGVVVLIVAFIFTRLKLPEITEADEAAAIGGSSTDEKAENFVSQKPLWDNKHFKMGAIAQACYVAAQTGIFSFLINFVTDKGMHPRFDVENAPFLLSFGFLLFMGGRLSGSAMMKKMKPQNVLAYFSLGCVILLPFVAAELGWTSLIALYLVFFLMSIMYPTIFALAIDAMGSKTKKASAYVVMGVAGGAVFPPLMGLVADTWGMAIGFLAPIPLFIFILYYATKGYKIVK